MPNKKDPGSPDKALEKRIDAMMDPRQPDMPVDPPAASPKPDAIDIFKAPETAPEVPDKLLKQIGATKAGPPTSKAASTSTPASDSETAPEPQAKNLEEQNPVLDDAATDKAVDDIAATESDAILAAEDATAKRAVPKAGSSGGWKAKLGRLLRNKWTWVGVGLLLIIIFAVPLTRYKLLGLVIKKPVMVSVVDSKTATPVSNASVVVGGKSAKTDANGKVRLSASLGQTKLKVIKQYYQSYSQPFFVGFKAPGPPKVRLVATGRQVPVTVLNKITGKPLANAEIKVLATTAKTNARGQAVVVLPASAASDAATITLSGYNLAKVSVQVTSSVVGNNSFALTPAGHVYFLSNLSGTIDVVKANLDGTGRQTVLAGTGHENPSTTSLLASRDWRYLALETQRDTVRPALYLIDTSNNKLTEFDNNNVKFNLVGWYDHAFIYDLESNVVAQSQTGHEIIKSYDADHLQLNQLDQTQAEGTASDYGYQNFSNFYLLNNEVTYSTQWFTFDSGGSPYDISGKSNTIRAVQPNGQSKKDYQSFAANKISYIQAALYKPQDVYYAVHNSDGSPTTYYNFEGQTTSAINTIDQNTFNQIYPTYLVSPSDNQTFWTELRDGKNTLFIGDANAQSAHQIASLSNYSPYGWFSDNYILVSQNNSELFIMPASSSSRAPVKISDYYKSPQTYAGYGYGYGGL